MNSTNHTQDIAPSLYREFDLPAYCRKFNLSAEAERYLLEASRAPSRHPNGYRSNTVRLPCAEFGHTVSAESASLEFAFLLIAKSRPDVLRIYEQGPRVRIQGVNSSGNPFSFAFTPDFLLLTETGVEICELEDPSESASYYLKTNNRYKLVDGRYTSPPVAEYFKRYGFTTMILSQHDLDPRFAQNARFLHPYQIGQPRQPITTEESDAILRAACAEPGILLSDVPFDSESRKVEIAYHLIAKGRLFTHLSECPLDKPERVRLYSTPRQERAFVLLRQSTRKEPADIKSLGYHLLPGALIEIDGEELKAARIGAKDIRLVDDTGKAHTLPHQALIDLKPKIGGIYNAEKTFETILGEASQEDLLEMQRRHIAIAPYLSGGADANKLPTDRTIRRWRDNYIHMQRETGVGLAGIFPGKYRAGNRNPRLSKTVEHLIKHVIYKYYLRSEAETAKNTHLRILALGARLKIADDDLPVYRTIARRCAALDSYKKAYRRYGKRVAHSYRPIHRGKSPLGSPHGQKSWMIAHCDSTQLDLARTHENQATQIEHLWHTKMVDAFDRRVLAWHMSSHRPSAETLQALMFECVQKHGVLPATIVADWGTEHCNTWMQKTMARIGVAIHYRPKATPVNGAPVESYFAKVGKELIHNLAGNTKLLQRARLVTKAVDPRNNTVWSEQLIRELLATYYDTMNDTPRRNRPSPNEIAATCEATFGPSPVQIADPELLRRILLPYVDRVRRKVSCRGTIRCEDSTYSNDELRAFAGKFVDVRFDPKEPRIVFADHPTQRRVIECSVVDPDIKYAEDAGDALRIVEYARRQRRTSAGKIQIQRIGLIEKVMQLENETKAQAVSGRPGRNPRSVPIAESRQIATIIPLKLEPIISQ